MVSVPSWMELACSARPTGPYIAWRMLLSAISAMNASASTPAQRQSVILLCCKVQAACSWQPFGAWLCAWRISHIYRLACSDTGCELAPVKVHFLHMPSSCSIVFRAYQQEPVHPSVRVNTLVSFRQALLRVEHRNALGMLHAPLTNNRCRTKL